jgi:superfamily II DNA helicase RecQ
MDSTSTLLLLSAPPASGKTHWIEQYQVALGEELLLVTPLRALADECRRKWGTAIRVVTPEEYLVRPPHALVVIFDEFHLYLYWGDSFRERMWEAFYGACAVSRLCVLLTATVSPELVDLIRSFAANFDQIIWVDRGNRQLKFLPRTYIKAPSRKWVIADIMRQQKGAGVRIVFCRYREEVLALAGKLSGAGFSCLTCLGGEAGALGGKLMLTPAPDYIVCTTVLSHGVNLPEISRVYLLYPTGNCDFWIQMIARGGRRGGNFNVIGLELPHSIPWSPIGNFLAVLGETIPSWFCLRQGLLPP